MYKRSFHTLRYGGSAMRIISKQVLGKDTTLIWLSNEEMHRDSIEREINNSIKNNKVCFYLLQKTVNSQDRIKELIINQLQPK
jgi:hypothetical protein